MVTSVHGEPPAPAANEAKPLRPKIGPAPVAQLEAVAAVPFYSTSLLQEGAAVHHAADADCQAGAISPPAWGCFRRRMAAAPCEAAGHPTLEGSFQAWLSRRMTTEVPRKSAWAIPLDWSTTIRVGAGLSLPRAFLQTALRGPLVWRWAWHP